MYSYSSSQNLRMPAYKPGIRPHANSGQGIAKEYANGSGGTRGNALLAFSLDAAATPGDRFNIDVRVPSGQFMPVEYIVPDPVPASAADLHEFIYDAIIDNSIVAGLGTWSHSVAGVALSAQSVGQQLGFNLSRNVGVATMTPTITQSEGFGLYVKPARAIVSDPTATYEALDDLRSAFGDGLYEIGALPTQDPTLPASTEVWQGVNMELEGEGSEVFSGFPSHSSYGQEISKIVPQLSVSISGPITLDLETPYAGGAGIPTLSYRFTADGDKNDIGIFTFESGAGLAPVPVRYRVIELTDSNTMASVWFEAV